MKQQQQSLLSFLFFLLAVVTAVTDYDAACLEMTALYTNCGCSLAPTVTLGVQGLSAFVQCDGVNVDGTANANFSGSDQYLYSMNQCQFEGCYLFLFEGSTPELNSDQPTSCTATTSTNEECNSCAICDTTTTTTDGTVGGAGDGMIINCSNVDTAIGAAMSTNETCVPRTSVLDYTFVKPPPASSAFGRIGYGWTTTTTTITTLILLGTAGAAFVL